MLQNVAERRIQDRLNLTLKVFERETGKRLGLTENIHCGGMMLLSTREFSNGEAIQVMIELPTDDETRKLALTAESRWCTLDQETSVHNVGFRFIHSSPEMRSFYQTLFDGLSS